VISTAAAIGLVARREVVERLRERSLWVSTAITVAVLAAVLLLPQALGMGGATQATVAVTDAPGARVAFEARRAQDAYDVELAVRRVSGVAAARRLVRSGDADVAVLPGARTLAAAEGVDDAVISAVQAGSSAVRAGPPPAPLPVARASDGGPDEREAVAFVAVIVLYGQLLGYAIWVAMGVVEEKSTRVVELLLSAITPRRLLAGKVLGIGALGLGQLLLIGVAGLAMGSATGQLDLDGGTVSALAIVLLWFVLGYALYSCAFAVAGALVPRQEDVQAVTAPLTITILAAFFLSFTALDDPSSTLARVLSFVPPAAPMIMPVRLIAGDVALWELVASVALTTAAAVGLVALAARIYGAAVLRTGSRVSLKAIWRATAARAQA
jgi:ABC-2 type transport system permease protein